ncbi:MAG: transglycosylase domain-containing protein, partial [Proteobacteria bacterium]|nr:transglycosylase domain-containing protein [Pseudomonadota bacterium]
MNLRILFILTFIVFLFTSSCSFVFFLFFYYGRDLPDYDYLHHYKPPVLTRFYDQKGSLFREYGAEKRIFVPIYDIPYLVIQAFLSAEDKNFFYHFGLDFLSVIRAALLNTMSQSWDKRPTGASTITQQVAKNFLVGNERSIKRKIKEAIMALRLEHALSKERILELYLNQIYLGNGCYGIMAASLHYFNKSLEELTLSEIAFLASLPKSPSNLSNLKRIQDRRDWVLGRLVEGKIITTEQAENAKCEPLHFATPRPLLKEGDYFADEVKRQIIQLLGADTFNYSGLTVRTTFDTQLQKWADEALQKGLIDYDRRHGFRGPIAHLPFSQEWADMLKKVIKPPGLGIWQIAVILKYKPENILIGFEDGTTSYLNPQSLTCKLWQKTPLLSKGDVIIVSKTNDPSYFNLEQIPDVSGAVVVMEAHTGKVLALSGGYSFDLNQFNCATQAWRQPGSAFKPFVYLTALENGYKPHTLILDAPISFRLHQGVYRPQNYSKKFYGPTPLRVGLEKSRNVMTVRLAQRLGMKRIEQVGKRFGLVDSLPKQLAMSLGAKETTLLRLTAAYAMLANGGIKITPYLIERVHNDQGRVLYTPYLHYFWNSNDSWPTLFLEEERLTDECHQLCLL